MDGMLHLLVKTAWTISHELYLRTRKSLFMRGNLVSLHTYPKLKHLLFIRATTALLQFFKT